MRILIALALVVSACSSEPPAPTLATGSFAGSGRDRLCISGAGEAMSAGIIVYGDGDTNCSAKGALTQADGQWSLVPRGEQPGGCRIGLAIANGTASVGSVGAACSYYCGPDASFAGKSFALDQLAATPATDFAGDPLC